MKKLRKNLTVILTALCIAALAVFVVACNGKNVTLTFETNGGTTIEKIVGLPGEDIIPPSAPKKHGYIFEGWYLNADFSGDSVRIPTTMPDKSTTYYAKYEIDPEYARGITYDINITNVSHNGNVTESLALPGDTVTVKDGADYNVSGYLFVGWSTSPNGNIQFTDGKADGQYNAGDSYTVADNNITLYAQWAKGYKQKNGNDTVYFYEKLFGSGLGGAITDKDGTLKLGFASVNTDTGYLEFTFIYDDRDVEGRINLLDETEFTYADRTKGLFVGYDYATEELTGFILNSDGYGLATLSSIIGSITKTEAYGVYSYDSAHDDFVFGYTDVHGNPIYDGESQKVFYFSTIDMDDYYEGYRGAFLTQGYESGSFLMYDNGELYNRRLDLNGYGYAKLYEYDPINEQTELIAEGAYKGTNQYVDYMGEWEFFSDTQGVGGFKFIVNAISSGSDNVLVYIEYDVKYDKEFVAANGNGDSLRMDGYGSAEYTVGDDHYVGYCTVGSNGSLVTFVPYIDNGDGNVVAGGKMYFNIDYTAGTFTVNTTGYVIDGTTLVEYKGTSKVIVIPDEVTAVSDDAFNYVHTDVSIVSVVIPASVKTIGVRAFQNSTSLRRATFLSETPIAIDWSSENSPFRWPAGDFIIVVPEASVAAYKTAWSDCPYTIKGSVEVTQLPEFEIKDGVLVRYNKQDGTSDELDIVIPDNVTEIANNVFRGLTFVKSVNFNNVTEIGDGAFEFCTSLKTATFTKVEIIGDGAFAGSGLSGEIELPEIVEIGESAFSSCTGLKRVKLGALIAEIGSFAFTECQTDADGDALCVEFLGSSAPLMGEKITVGNIAFRFVVQNIVTVKRCYEASSWTSYCRHLYIESGAEKGMYMSGTNTLELDGRAILDGATVYMYEINDAQIKFYLFNGETAEVTETVGTIADDVITVTFDGVNYSFEKVKDSKTYTSDDGNYTLTCNPSALLPESYEGYTGYADVTFNGQPAKLYINGYSTKKITTFRDDDGKLYDFTLTFDGDTFTYTKVGANYKVENITCNDGSVINLHYMGNLVYIYGELKLDVGDGSFLPSWGDFGTTATETSENVFTFTRLYKNVKYNITVTVSSDKTSFTYTYVTA